MSAYNQLRQSAYDANIQLPKLGLATFTFGNVSVAEPVLRVFAIKPSGIPYDALSPEKMVIVDFNGKVVDGGLRPSSDTLTHALLYHRWKDIGSIVHTHSTYATAWAQARKDIPLFGTTHADFMPCDIPCAAPMSDKKIAGNYEMESGNQIIECLEERTLDYHKVEMVLLGSHAPFAWGIDSAKALYNAAMLEEIARMAYFTLQINPKAHRLKDALIKKHFERKHGPSSYYGQ